MLGVTLGLLALAAFLLLLFLCSRRRKKRQQKLNAKERPFTPSDDGLDRYHENRQQQSFNGPGVMPTSLSGTTAVAPYLSEREKEPFRHPEHTNPYVPTLPSSRASLSRNDLSAMHHYDDQRYPVEQVMPQPHNRQLAAGALGGAVGGLAAHQIDKHHRDRSLNRESSGSHVSVGPGVTAHDYATYTPPGREHRRSGSFGEAGLQRPWPYNKEDRRSGELRRSLSRPQDGPLPDGHYPSRDFALAGVAGATTRKSTSKSPHRRKGILKQTTSDSSEPHSLSSDGGKGPFTDRYASRPPIAHHPGPHELGAADDGLLTGRHGDEQVLGSGGGGLVTDPERQRRYSRGARGNRDIAMTPLTAPPPLQTRRADTPPTVPSRSPRRSSFHNNAIQTPAILGTSEPHTQNSDPARQLMSVSPAPEVHNGNSSTSNDGFVSPVSAPSRQDTFSEPHSGSQVVAPVYLAPGEFGIQRMTVNNPSTSDYSAETVPGQFTRHSGVYRDPYNSQVPDGLRSHPPAAGNTYPEGSEGGYLYNRAGARPQYAPESAVSSGENADFGNRAPQPRPNTIDRHLQLMGKDSAMQDYRNSRNYDPRLTRNSSQGNGVVGVAR